MIALSERLPAQEILAAFRADGIYADARSQVLRMSAGGMTTQAGVERMLVVLARLLG